MTEDLKYSLYISIPYEGQWEAVCYSSLEEIKDFLRENNDYCLDDMELICHAPCPSIYEVAEEAYKEKS